MKNNNKYVSTTGTALPPKDENAFNQAVKHYEDKEYKKGIRLCDQILANNPKSGKTLALKGIMIFSTKNNEKDGEPLLKQGVELDPKSHIAWHVYGIFHRTMKRFTEAQSAYETALSLDPDNIQILIDLSSLQLQNRDYPGFVLSKEKLVQLRSNQGQFWIGLIFGHYLCKHYQRALEILKAYKTTLDKDHVIDYVDQEMKLFECLLYKEDHKYQEAIDVLLKDTNFILNDILSLEMIASLYLLLNNYEEASKYFNILLERNVENYAYYRGLECCFFKDSESYSKLTKLELLSNTTQLSDEQRKGLLDMYNNIIALYPRAHAPKNILLTIYTPEDFTTFIEPLLRKAIRKGMPTFLNSLHSLLMSDSSKLLIIKNLLLAYVDSLLLNKTLPIFEGEHLEYSTEEPMVIFWTYYLLAQIYDFVHDYENACLYIARAIEHTPTSTDAYLLQAKIYKHEGDILSANDSMRVCNELDLADRYMNTKRTKMLLKNNRINEADEVITYWTRKETALRNEMNLLQVNWYEIECADAYYRTHNIPLAYKMYSSIIAHFKSYCDDTYDFNGYIFRKATLRSTINTIRTVDSIYKHKYFTRAAVGILKCVEDLEAHPELKVVEPTQKPFVKKDTKKSEVEYDEDQDINGLEGIKSVTLDSAASIASHLLSCNTTDSFILYQLTRYYTQVKDTNTLIKILNYISKLPEFSPYVYLSVQYVIKSNNDFGRAKFLVDRLVSTILNNETLDNYIQSSYKNLKDSLINRFYTSLVYFNEGDTQKASHFLFDNFESLDMSIVPSIKDIYLIYEQLKELSIEDQYMTIFNQYSHKLYPKFDIYAQEFHKQY